MAKRQQKRGRGGRVRKKNVVVEANGMAFIRATFNNVIVTVTDQYGNCISWSSSGKEGFKGSRKSTPYAAQVASTTAASEAYDLGLRRVDVYVKGPGSGRESAIRALSSSGLEIATIRDVTPIPPQWLPAPQTSPRIDFRYAKIQKGLRPVMVWHEAFPCVCPTLTIMDYDISRKSIGRRENGDYLWPDIEALSRR